MEKGFLLAHDLGTSGNKATLYDTSGKLAASAVYSYGTAYSHNCRAEQNPEEWWAAVCSTTRALLETPGIAPADVLCVSFSAQMMGCLLVDGNGAPLRDMITWADARAQKQELWMTERAGMENAYRITGHRLGASYSAAKLLWVKENEPDVYKSAHKMVQAKDYIAFRLTGNLMTDYSDASGTNLLDIEKKAWSQELLDAFRIRRDLLPELRPSTDVAGAVTPEAARACGLPQGTPVVVGGGDGSCACVGAGAVGEGKAYSVIGTSSWISCASGKPHFDEKMRTFNWVHLDPGLYAPCGTMQAAGLSYQWYKNALCQAECAQAEREGRGAYAILDEEAAGAPAGAGGVLFLPYLIGERSPRWNLDARGAFVGLGASTRKSDMARAVLEGVGFNLRIILETVSAGRPPDSVVMIGGGAKGRTWLQILADIWQTPLAVPAYIEEATSMGAAICGGVGIGLYRDFGECAGFNRVVGEVRPNPASKDRYDQLYKIFSQAYEGLVPAYGALAEYRRNEAREPAAKAGQGLAPAPRRARKPLNDITNTKGGMPNERANPRIAGKIL
jgi:xylulokinase